MLEDTGCGLDFQGTAEEGSFLMLLWVTPVRDVWPRPNAAEAPLRALAFQVPGHSSQSSPRL